MLSLLQPMLICLTLIRLSQNNRILTYVQLFWDDFTQEMLAQDEASRKAELVQKRKALFGAQKRMEELDKIIQRLYKDSVLGKLSDSVYVTIELYFSYVGKIRIPPAKPEPMTATAKPA